MKAIRRSIQLFIFITAVLVTMLVLLSGCESAGTQVAIASETVYQTNQAGKTYGSTANSQDPSEYPDLIEAQATNGQVGYVYAVDLYYAIEPYPPKNPEEAVKLMENRFMASAFVFAESVKAQTGEAIDIGLVLAEIRATYESDSNGLSFDSLTNERQQSFLALIPGVENAQVVVSIAFDEAIRANDRSIPVYDVDGETVIGEFIIG